MLTRFALDPVALLAAGDGEHKRLAREWVQCGVLCHNGASFAESELAPIIEKLPQAARILWQKILKTAWIKPAPEGWAGVCGLEDHPDSAAVLNGELDLACLEETRLELAREEVSRSCPNLELGQLKDIDTTKAFERSHSLSEKRTDNIKVSELWRERFAVSASVVRNVTIVDRFALADGEGINGLEAFLVLLDGSGHKVNITIYSSFGDDRLNLTESEAQDRMVAIRQRLARGGAGGIKMFLTDSRSFGRVEHDRFVKFDHLVFEIGSGMAVFNGRDAKQSTFSSKLEQDGHRQAVQQLRRLCGMAYPVMV